MGYKNIKLKDGSTRNQHRLIVEKQIGRQLSYNEVVHHGNEKKGDNDPENLEIKSRSEHSRMHMKGRRLSDATKNKISNALKGRPNTHERKLSPNQVRELRKMREEKVSLSVLSTIFGINRKSVILIAKGMAYTDIV